ncbi:MAG: hypothetical protein N3F05_01005 [Candidatus Diapherotrites archaeon]|nr:hypothetical protein [Candidatus Diapherotrites archaeon]
MPLPKNRLRQPKTSRAVVIKRELKQMTSEQIASLISAAAKQPLPVRVLLAKGLNTRRLKARGFTAKNWQN